MKISKFLVTLAIPFFIALGMTACEQDGPAERAGEKIDNSMEKAGDKMEEMGDKIEDAADDAAH